MVWPLGKMFVGPRACVCVFVGSQEELEIFCGSTSIWLLTVIDVALSKSPTFFISRDETSNKYVKLLKPFLNQSNCSIKCCFALFTSHLSHPPGLQIQRPISGFSRSHYDSTATARNVVQRDNVFGGEGVHSHKTFIDFSEKNELRKTKCWPLFPFDTSSFSQIKLSWWPGAGLEQAAPLPARSGEMRKTSQEEHKWFWCWLHPGRG